MKKTRPVIAESKITYATWIGLEKDGYEIKSNSFVELYNRLVDDLIKTKTLIIYDYEYNALWATKYSLVDELVMDVQLDFPTFITDQISIHSHTATSRVYIHDVISQDQRYLEGTKNTLASYNDDLKKATLKQKDKEKVRSLKERKALYLKLKKEFGDA